VYSYSTDFVLDAFTKAYETALTNYDAAAALKEKGLHGPATSLAVLALEECGKMFLLDGLLFARGGDERHQRFTKGHRTHTTKLDTLELFPLFLHYLTTTDPRESEPRYKQTMVIILTELKQRRQAIADLMGDDFQLSALDALKQKGFYSHHVGTACSTNQEGISPELADAVISLAWRVVDSLRFVLRVSLDNYKQRFVTLRSKLDEASLTAIREQAVTILDDIFPPNEAA